jgi:hypothetical protein
VTATATFSRRTQHAIALATKRRSGGAGPG